VRFGEVIAQDMIAVPIGPRQRTAIVASPDYFERHPKPVTPEDLKQLPCIRFRFDSGRFYAWEFERGGIEVACRSSRLRRLRAEALTRRPRRGGIRNTWSTARSIAAPNTKLRSLTRKVAS
jgi:LysR substrate binding domain